ncbi:MAG TPA: MATE family efflux transporter [Chloroflexota bacterium]|jgi:putative MATE family efflux protein|nr:MATE family efflux transporter [Chloroflexota bacterium]
MREEAEAGALAGAAAATLPPLKAVRAAPARPGRKGLALDEDRLVRSVNGLAIPIIAENLFQTLLGVVDLLMVSTLGAVAIAGVGTSLQIMFLVIAALASVTVGTTVLVARFTGGGQPEEASRVAKQSLLMGFVLAAVITVLGHLFAHPVVALLGVEPDVAKAGGDYLDVVALTSVFLITQLICGGALRGAGDTRTPMVVTGLVNVVNVAVAYGLIFGHFGLPALGVIGSALGASVARMIGALALLAVLGSGRRTVDLRGRAGWRPDVGLMKRVLRIGLPSMVEQSFMSGGMLFYSLIVIGMGTAVYAAQRITFNALSISFMPGLGFGMAATTMTGQALGAKRADLAQRSTWIAFRMAALWMCTMGLGLFVFDEPIMRAFSDDPVIVATGAAALRVIALSQPLQALGQVMAGSLRGAGDTRFPMLATGISVWLVRLPFGWLFGVPLGWGLSGVYISNVMDAGVRAAANYLRYRSGRWRTTRV